MDQEWVQGYALIGETLKGDIGLAIIVFLTFAISGLVIHMMLRGR